MVSLSTLSPQALNLWQQVQGLFGADNVTLTSAGRTAGNNASIPGASKTSDHLDGNAFDFRVKGIDPQAVQERIAAAGIGYGQNIAEYGAGMGPRNHLSIPTAKHAGENLLGVNGSYKKLGSDLRAKVNAWESSLLQQFGVSKSSADVLTDPNATTGDAVSAALNLNGWFSRITLALFALLLLAAALFMLGRSELPSIPGAK
jgi:hypothetical protein